LIGKTIFQYNIIEKLGEGGMGVVYKALDTKLDRFVALKFLPQHLSQSDEEKQRFIREAKAASALDHPNICTIYEISETEEGQIFISMAYYTGETIKDKIERGTVPVQEVLDYIVQAAQGLSKAHAEGIIHRDIKPANIMVTADGVVKLVDFGLAKMSSQTQLTKVGTTLGTASYMSPEQTRGEVVDARTDVWSLGVVLYELLTGERPFRGDYEQAVIYSILNEDPEPVANLEQVPNELWRIIKKTLQKHSANRYKKMTELIKNLKAIKKTLEAKQHILASGKANSIPSIVVLPFENMSADPEQEYFCDGMAEEIINALVNVQGLRVAARTSAFAFKGKQVDVREIGRKLSVDIVLEGSVRKAGTRLRITAQLTEVDDGYHIWSERYDRELQDVFEIQDGISRSIVDVLKVKLKIANDEPLVKRATENLEAYDAYLRGIYYYNLRTENDNDNAIKFFERATNLDFTFALAFAALADAYIEKFFSYQPAKRWEEKAFVALEKALAIDSQLAEAHVAKGLLLWTKSHNFPHENAIDEFKQAIAIKPGMVEAHLELARVIWHVGLLDEGFKEIQKAIEIDPTQIKGKFRMGYLEIHRGNFTKALALLRKIPSALYAESKDAMIAMCLFYLDRKEEAYAQIQRADENASYDPNFLSTEAILLADARKEKEAVKKINLAIEKGRHLGHFHHIANNIAEAYAIMNKKKLALDWLEETAEDGFPCYLWFEKDPCLQNIRNEPRFKALIKRLRMKWDPTNLGGSF